MDKKINKAERLAAIYEFHPYELEKEKTTVVWVMDKDEDGNAVSRQVRIGLAEKNVIDSIVQRLYAEHSRYIHRTTDDNGIIRLAMSIIVDLPEDVLPQETQA